MAISSANKTVLGEAFSWIFAGLCVAGSLFYFDELKGFVAPAVKTVVDRSAKPHQPAAASLRRSGNPQETISDGNIVQLSAGADGHFETVAKINGSGITVLVDTGASYVGLTFEDAESAGIFVTDEDFKYKARTANGEARIAVVDIDRVSIGDIEVRHVKATIARPGAQHVTLLGMSFLNKLRRAELRSGQLILEN